jgi:putative ABC transport system permease protein
VLSSIGKDLRYAFRQLVGSPAFTIVALLSLALGIGANTAIFQLVDAIRLRVLPARDPASLVSINLAPGSMRSGSRSTRSADLTYAQWTEIGARQQAFSAVLAWSATRFDLSSGGQSRMAEGLYVTGAFFRALGVAPVLGRVFAVGDDVAGCPPAAVVSERFWRRQLGGDPAVLGRAISLDGRPFPIIGVTPGWFFGVEVGQAFDVAVPLCADRLMADGRGRIPDREEWWLAMSTAQGVGRLDRSNRRSAPWVIAASSSRSPDSARWAMGGPRAPWPSRRPSTPAPGRAVVWCWSLRGST